MSQQFGSPSEGSVHRRGWRCTKRTGHACTLRSASAAVSAVTSVWPWCGLWHYMQILWLHLYFQFIFSWRKCLFSSIKPMYQNVQKLFYGWFFL